MNHPNSVSFRSTLRSAAGLLVALPALVALACFAHGHGAYGATGLGLALVACLAVGALAARRLMRLLETDTPNAVAAHGQPLSNASQI